MKYSYVVPSQTSGDHSEFEWYNSMFILNPLDPCSACNTCTNKCKVGLSEHCFKKCLVSAKPFREPNMALLFKMILTYF